MPRTAPVTVKVTDLPAAEAAITDAVAAAVAEERRRLVTLVRATCACQSCKDGVAGLLATESLEAADLDERPAT